MGVLIVTIGTNLGLIPADNVPEFGWYETVIGIAVAIFLTRVTYRTTLNAFFRHRPSRPRL